jgi:signal transduction histidine kinase
VQDAVQLQVARCDARELVDNALHAFRGQALGRAIRLRTVVPIGLAVHADPERIQQVLQLLLGVALRSARIGGEITTTVQSIDGWIRFSIADLGPVAPAAEGAPVLSRTLVEAHHGKLGIEAAVGRGHTLWFALPNQRWC